MNSLSSSIEQAQLMISKLRDDWWRIRDKTEEVTCKEPFVRSHQYELIITQWFINIVHPHVISIHLFNIVHH